MRKSNLRAIFATALLVTTTSIAQAGDITVSAAASLTNAFKEIAQIYQTQHPNAKVALNFGGSGALLQQIAKGAPVDVFASADQETMDAAEKQGLVANIDRHNFVKNNLVLIVPKDSQFSPKRLQDLTQVQVKRIAIGNPASVPVGRYTVHALASVKLWPGLESKAINTQNVRQSLDYVARGEVDAGFVYATDASIMSDKVTVAFEVPLDVAISYPIAIVKDSKNREEAKRFIRFLASAQSQAILSKYGFQKP
ncbi:molybdate ABC transporter substrate-binding protein [Undibacterium macrobrachii]|uniref:Molybdate ABC transporter substrate-binding protein n=1 Tax=Undibacterium macrobrachii TaxID=1119058 RepID=A0ABQ2X4R6_9BURK|nr:molybdate ABC transporter substrate-binding protein [Undibacterium macrobrachii]GGW99729.1 molybdate ABC transporter substrate-binding protein [Undibacterium macrobrachii]